MINGSPTDNNATLFKKGAHSVIDSSGYKVVAEFDTPDWSPDKAQEWMAGQVTQFGSSIVGVYAANDGTAGGAIAAMKAGGVTPLPPVTGQDAELPAIQRIVNGDQFMTVYKALKLEAETAAQLAVDLLSGKKVTGDSADTDGVPTTLLKPVVVTIDNIMDTVVADGFYKVADICTADYADACAAAGIK
jgi:D-xylose transport system substrate-binding protein